MRKRDALKLHNRDEVEVRVDGKWSPGYVLGDPQMKKGSIIRTGEPYEDYTYVMIPVQSQQHGYIHVHHTDVR